MILTSRDNHSRLERNTNVYLLILFISLISCRSFDGKYVHFEVISDGNKAISCGKNSGEVGVYPTELCAKGG